MATEEASQERRCELEENTSESDEFESSDDSDDDPSFKIVEETRSALSKLSIKKPQSRRIKAVSVSLESEPEKVAENEIPKLDEKSFEKVQQLLEDGHVEKLKVDQCKVYLRKYGLRLTGNKDVLISRIKEHIWIINGCGEEKYPLESFVINCKGDACLGDIVIFEQNVYEMYSIASRSATGPPCGTRTIVGRILKESYGISKQQHTFTIEVLWSKGEKPLPPLHQLLIKGRNLYRIKTTRQRWADEGERQKILQEKHGRGSQARYARELRMQDKGKRNGMMTRRRNVSMTGIQTPNKENQHPQSANSSNKNINPPKSAKEVNSLSDNIYSIHAGSQKEPMSQNFHSTKDDGHKQQHHSEHSNFKDLTARSSVHVSPNAHQRHYYSARPHEFGSVFQHRNNYSNHMHPTFWANHHQSMPLFMAPQHSGYQRKPPQQHFSHHQSKPTFVVPQHSGYQRNPPQQHFSHHE